jgi:hypothetical protein
MLFHNQMEKPVLLRPVEPRKYVALLYTQRLEEVKAVRSVGATDNADAD